MAGTPGDMEERIKQIMADVLDLEPTGIDGDTAMDTIERWDSLTHITLCLSLEQDFQVSFTVGEMEAMLSYDDILLVLGEKLR
jgi:acyl carrier protein